MLPLQTSRASRFVRLIVAVITFTALFYSLSRTWQSTRQLLLGLTTQQPELPVTLKPESPVSDTTLAFPTKIWHSARTESLSATQREWVDSWTKKNPFYRQELLTDHSSAAFVREHFSKTRPDIVDVYESLPIPILRADLLRYLIILANGGVWSDLDVTCEKNVTDWVPPEYQDQNVDMVVGLEFDMEWHGPGTEVASQFCNWVFMAKKSSRNLLVIVDSVVATIKDIAAANGVQVEDLTLDMLPIDVVNVTGPKIMTIALMESLSKLLGREVDDRDFSGIKRPKLIGDVLIMPGVSFAAAQNGYPKDQGDALVSHHYEGSWKKADAEAKARKAQNAG